jgi:hypothetical protein
VLLDLSKLNFTFTTPPLLIGGKAMEYYGLRPAGADIDFVVTQDDYLGLRAQYPERLKELWGDLGVCPFEFEIWRTICLYGYADLCPGAIEQDGYRIISLEKLLFLKALGYKVEKYRIDLGLIVEQILKERYAEHFEPTLRWASALPGAEDLVARYKEHL